MLTTETGSVCWRCKGAGSTSLGSGLYRRNEASVGTFTVTTPSGRVRRETLCGEHVRGYRSAGWKVE